MRIDGASGPLEITDLGQPDAPAFVAVGSSAGWLPTFESLARSWRCVAFDGGTSVADLTAVLDHLGLRSVVLAGEGAAAAAAVAAAAALVHRAEALVLVDAEVDPADPALATLHRPTLVLHGQDDPQIPVARAEALAQAIAGAELILVAGGGHEPTVAKPHLVVDLLDGWGRRRLDDELA